MKSLRVVLITFCTCIFFNHSIAQQCRTAVPFLLISPSTEMNGMGETSIATVTDDPFGSYRNPAILGWQSFHSYFSFSRNWNKWLPNFTTSEKYRTFGFAVGSDLAKLSPTISHISIGLAYSNISMDLGEFERRGELNEDLGTFSANESSQQLTLSSAINSWVTFSAGASLKWISSELDAQSIWYKGTAKVFAADIGFFLNVPTIDISSRWLHQSLEIAPNYSPFFDISFGTSWTNIGNKVTYIQASQADPLPRTIHNGIGFDLGVSYKSNDRSFRLLSLQWTIEASDLLVRWNCDTIRNSDGVIISINGPSWQYQSGFGDLQYASDLIRGDSNPFVEKRKGWEFNFIELFSIRGGSVEGASDHRFVKTSGFSINPLRFFKVWNAIYPEFITDDTFRYILTHLNIRYSQSEWDTPNNSFHPLDGTKFYGLYISFSQ
jgi:hypothetical protein